jgi:hypothetical protein
MHGERKTMTTITSAEKWAKLREQGRSRFVWLYGVLGWGVSTAILFSLWNGIRDGWDGFFFKLIPALVLFPLGGYLWGRFMWWFLETMHDGAVIE